MFNILAERLIKILSLMVNLSMINFMVKQKRRFISHWYSYFFAPNSHDFGFDGIALLKGAKNIKIGHNCSFGKDLFLTAWGENANIQIDIGDNCCFGAYNHISAINKIIIGDNFVSGKNVSIIDNNHGKTDYQSLQIHPYKRLVVSPGSIIIGKNVWVGDKVTILSNVKIGDGCVIGANSVVTKDIPSYSVVVGVPAKKIN